MRTPEERRLHARRRRAAIGRSIRFNLGLLLLLAGGAFLYLERAAVAPLVEAHGDRIGEAAEILREAQIDAIPTEPVFELRRRVEEMFERCVGIADGSGPLRIERMPNLLALRVPGEPRAALELDFGTLKADGLGSWALIRDSDGLRRDQAEALSMLAALAIHAPDAPCPGR